MLIRPIILSGGSGTRMWPISRKRLPKQFASLVDNKSLFSEALLTTSDRKRFAAPVIIGNIDHKFLILDTLERLGIKDAIIYLEPIGRNTATPTIVAALAEKEEDIAHIVLPSDHVIADKTAFTKAIEEALPAVQDGHFALFGINPTAPETGFGYIMPGKPLIGAVQTIECFCEKPNKQRAGELITQGALWNSGIFFYKPSLLIEETKALAPEHLDLCQQALSQAEEDETSLLLGSEAYIAMKNHPFDRLIMERTTKGSVVPCSIGWNDLGSWQALWAMSNKDENYTAKVGDVVAMETNNSYIHSTGPTVAVLGVSDLTIIATKDAVLVTPLSRSQDVKDLVSSIQDTNSSLALEHRRVLRPWGSYESIAGGDRFQVKHIIVAPGKALSLQMHHHRAEHWVVVEGTAKVECDGKEKLVFPNESVYIPGGTTHRLTNPGKIDLQLIEVQSGDYLGEDDIVRFDDKYGRK